MSGVLGRAALLARLAATPPLLSGLADAATQVQPHGVDLRLESVWRFAAAGRLGRDAPGGGDRALPAREEIAFDAGGAVHLAPGPYLVRFAERVRLPTDLMALARPRSTLLRCGAALHTAVWDAGYEGRSEALLVVANPAGLRLERGARICQMVFFPLDAPGAAYTGAYQGENL
ncbi:MAG TPA: deoxyuridine 5'-triphosphate nucleotidohydrolase [Chloroflexota bacterium]|nr:deoxyuridine 5'-triphosphate nucleotidohydrolase [Chloroflexota bacterium]